MGRRFRSFRSRDVGLVQRKGADSSAANSSYITARAEQSVLRSGGTADDEVEDGDSGDSKDTDISRSPNPSTDEAGDNTETSPEGVPAQPSERRAEAMSLVFGRLAQSYPTLLVGSLPCV